MSTDISRFIVPKSDQLNAEDFIGGPRVFTIVDVKVRETPEQPVSVIFAGGFRPWKPCKTTMRILSIAWGTDASNWIGKSVRLYRDPSVLWAGKPEGGIRIAALSHMRAPLEERLSVKKGQRAPVRVEILPPSEIPPTDEVEIARGVARAALGRGWTKEQIATAMGGAKIEGMTPEQRGRFLRDLMHAPGTVSDPAAEQEEE